MLQVCDLPPCKLGNITAGKQVHRPLPCLRRSDGCLCAKHRIVLLRAVRGNEVIARLTCSFLMPVDNVRNGGGIPPRDEPKGILVDQLQISSLTDSRTAGTAARSGFQVSGWRPGDPR